MQTQTQMVSTLNHRNAQTFASFTHQEKNKFKYMYLCDMPFFILYVLLSTFLSFVELNFSHFCNSSKVATKINHPGFKSVCMIDTPLWFILDTSEINEFPQTTSISALLTRLFLCTFLICAWQRWSKPSVSIITKLTKCSGYRYLRIILYLFFWNDSWLENECRQLFLDTLCK